MYGAIFVNFMLFVSGVLWLLLKSPDSLVAIFFFLLLLFGNFTFFFSYPIYFINIRKKHHQGLEKKVYRISLKWGGLSAFLICGILGLKAFDLWNILNIGLFISLWIAILMGMRKNRV